MDKKIDISSTVLEKGLEIAKSFLDKLIMPAIEETGLLLKDQVTLWKFKNQIKMLNKAKVICEKNNISPKTISLKLLCPLLEYSGYEEDEVLMDKWAILLSNMVDSEQNIENHVFPYILSQLSSSEFLILERVYNDKKTRIKKLTNELEEFREVRPVIEHQLSDKSEELKNKIIQLRGEDKSPISKEIWELQKEKREIDIKITSIRYKESSILFSIRKSEPIPFDSLKEFELSNLIRLGLVKEIKEYYTRSQTLEIPNDSREDRSHLKVDLDIDIESNTENIMTELGELFINACEEKTNNR